MPLHSVCTNPKCRAIQVAHVIQIEGCYKANIEASEICRTCGHESKIPKGIYTNIGSQVMIEAANSKDLELLVSLEKVLLRSIIQNKPLDSDIQFRRNSKQFQKLLGGLSPNLIRSLPTETKIAIYCAVISTISTICDIAGIFDKEPKVIHQHFHENIHNFYDVPLKDIVKQRNKILKQRLQNPKKGNDSRNSA